MELSADDGSVETGSGAGGRNCVVLKPSEITPLTALKLAELAKDIFPAGVINVPFGRGKTVGDPLTGHPKVRMVSLTGSIATGEHIISHTAPSIKRTHMELGGKAPVIVLMMRILKQWSKVYVHLAITMPDRIVLWLVGSTRKKAFTIRWWKTRCCSGNVKIWCAG